MTLVNGATGMRSIRLSSYAIVVGTALLMIGASVVPASAHFTTTRCDRDGDDCYTARCDDDGDDCRRVASYPRYDYNRRSYYGYQSRAYGDWNGYGRYYDNGRYNRYNNDYYDHRGRGGYDEDDEED